MSDEIVATSAYPCRSSDVEIMKRTFHFLFVLNEQLTWTDKSLVNRTQEKA